MDHVIVGLPLQMDGTEGKSAKKARRWAANLEKRLQAESEDSDSTEYQIPQVSLIDERLTTVSAHRQLFEPIKLRTSTGRWLTSSRSGDFADGTRPYPGAVRYRL
mgnify:FL=1